uniref:Uncharacterized protein n=1 Tax=Anguilla anguilla TaxID=7936 RepID=A0A0E9PYB1_ANGAN
MILFNRTFILIYSIQLDFFVLLFPYTDTVTMMLH